MHRPVFFSVRDIALHFEKNPDRLVAYVERGISRRSSVLGVHIAQLADMVDMRLRVGKYVCPDLPEEFYKPEKFDNIKSILTEAYKRFPAPVAA